MHSSKVVSLPAAHTGQDPKARKRRTRRTRRTPRGVSRYLVKESRNEAHLPKKKKRVPAGSHYAVMLAAPSAGAFIYSLSGWAGGLTVRKGFGQAFTPSSLPPAVAGHMEYQTKTKAPLRNTESRRRSYVPFPFPFPFPTPRKLYPSAKYLHMLVAQSMAGHRHGGY